MKHLILITLVFLITSFCLFAQQPQNPGFEEWEDAGTVIEEPVNWSSIKTSDAGDYINNLAPVVWGKSTDARSGNFSVELTNIQSIVLATGIVTNGRIHADLNPDKANAHTVAEDEKWHTAFINRPDSIVVWAKYFPQGIDTAQVKVILHVSEGSLPATPENEGNWIGSAQINIYGQVNEWTRFSLPITYFSTVNPEYLLLVLTSGAGVNGVANSKVRYDDLEFIYIEGAGTGDLNSLSENLIYVSGNQLQLERLPASKLDNASIEIIDLRGSVVYTKSIVSDQIHIGQLNLTPALYVVRISGHEINYSQKLFLR
ncbi:MAG: hypothetical protein IH598_10575 [Bacteroidales bacterium]|nr:hypothetical protein [Bacteroidales bacterium]